MPFLKRHLSIFVFLSLAGLLSGCLDKIDLTQGLPLPDGIVVSGRLSVGEERAAAEVKLEALFRFENSNRPDRIVTADVRVINDLGQELSLTYVDENYTASVAIGASEFQIEEGMTFFVDVTTQEGVRYQSEPEELLPSLPITEATGTPTIIEVENRIGVLEEELAIDYQISAPLVYPDGRPAYLRWLMEETYAQTDESRAMAGPKTCYVTTPYEGRFVKVLSSGGANSIAGFSLGKSVPGFRYAEGHYMVISQSSLTRRAFEYFEQVDQVASRDLSIFEPAGGPINGNVYSVDGSTANVFGYFYVEQPSIARVPITPEEAGNPGTFCPLNTRFPPPISRCTDCLTAKNSTIQMPEWWQL